MAASNTDDRDDDVPGDTPRELGDDDVASRWADIVATLGDMDVARADGETGGTEKSAASSQTSRSDDEGSDGDGARGPGGGEPAGADGAGGDRAGGDRAGGDRGGGRQVGGWSDGGWAAGDWTTSGTEADGASGAAGAGAEPGRTRPDQPSGPRDWPLSPEVEALEEADSHFTPPEPPALLSRDPLLTMAWSFVVGIPVLAVIGMIVSAAVPAVSIPPLAGQIGLGLFVAGLGVLIWRMPHQRDPDDDGPGAVV